MACVFLQNESNVALQIRCGESHFFVQATAGLMTSVPGGHVHASNVTQSGILYVTLVKRRGRSTYG